MWVEMVAKISGTRNGEDWPNVGQRIELPDAEAVSLINAKCAVPVSGDVETAAVKTAKK